MIQQNDSTYFDLKGALAFDPCIGNFDAVQEEYVFVPYIERYNNVRLIYNVTNA